MTVFLGIDGGGTGCRATASDAAGRILGVGAAGPANVATDAEGARRNVLAAAQEALGEVEPGRVVAVLGLAGANRLGAAEGLRSTLPFGRCKVVTDAITAVRGALGRQDGIVVAVGTGSVLAVQREGQMRQMGGHGFVLGDEGSGAVLGRALLSRALRAADGLADETPLLRQVLEDFGGPQGVIDFAAGARPADFAALAPRLIDTSDAAAEAILSDAVADLHRMLTVLQSLGVLPVTFIGGLGPTYAARLGGHWPLRAPLGSALDGAMAMAREMEA